jgi:hypothetical protein
MRRHANVVEMLKDVFGNPVVEDTLALDHLVLLCIVSGRIILEVLDQCSGLGTFVQDLGLAFVNAATALHGSVPWFVNVHVLPWLRVEQAVSYPRRTNAAAQLTMGAVASMVGTYPIEPGSTIKDIAPSFGALTCINSLGRRPYVAAPLIRARSLLITLCAHAIRMRGAARALKLRRPPSMSLLC